MGLDISLRDPTATYNGWLYGCNITHNLVKKAKKAGLYYPLWRPEEVGFTCAKDIITPIEMGLEYLKSKPDYFNTFNDPNGWGMYFHFVPFVEEYLAALKKYPEAVIELSR